MAKYYKIPGKIQLYTVCEQCGKTKPWPDKRATKYCGRSCRDKAYYRRKKREKNMELVDAADFEEPDQD